LEGLGAKLFPQIKKRKKKKKKNHTKKKKKKKKKKHRGGHLAADAWGSASNNVKINKGALRKSGEYAGTGDYKMKCWH